MERGSAKVKLSLNKSVFIPGEVLYAKLSLGTFCMNSFDLDWVSFQAHGYFLLKSRSPSPSSFQRTICPHQAPIIFSIYGAEIASGDIIPDFSSKNLPISATAIFSSDVIALMATKSNFKSFVFKLALPEMLPPSFRGVLARIFYFVSVSIKLKSRLDYSMMHVPFAISSPKFRNLRLLPGIVKRICVSCVDTTSVYPLFMGLLLRVCFCDFAKNKITI
jgi:hypothetical protein